MVLESVYRNYGKAVKEKGLRSFTLLNNEAIEMISNFSVNDISEMYEPFGLRYLKNEARAWGELKNARLVEIIKGIIMFRKSQPSRPNSVASA